MSQQLPQKLVPFLPHIRNLYPLNQTIQFNPNDWQDHAAILKELAAAYPNEIGKNLTTRAVVMDAGDRANDGQLSWDAFFVAVMLFGFGKTGYGSWRTTQMLKTPDFNGVFSKIRQHLKAGKIKDAYNAAVIDECGPAFFTKLFYFLGWTFKMQPFPLILDARVAGNLVKCNDSNFNSRNYFNYSLNKKGKVVPRWSANGYVEYCNDLDAWTTQHDCHTADKIEMFLFDPPSGF